MFSRDSTASEYSNWKCAQTILKGGCNYQHPHSDTARVNSYAGLDIFPFVALHAFGVDKFTLWVALVCLFEHTGFCTHSMPRIWCSCGETSYTPVQQELDLEHTCSFSLWREQAGQGLEVLGLVTCLRMTIVLRLHFCGSYLHHLLDTHLYQVLIPKQVI